MVDHERLHRAMEEAGFDVVVASSYINVFYTSGVAIRTIKSIPLRLALVVVPLGAPPLMIVCNVEESLVRQQAVIGDVISYVEFQTSPIAVLAEILRHGAYHRGRIGIEMTHLIAHYYDELRGALPDARIESCDRLFEALRAVKSPQEIRSLREGAALAQRVIVATLRDVTVGDSERDIAWQLESRAWAAGADGLRFCYVGVGQNSALIHPAPGARCLEAGDVLRLDAAVYKGVYAADLAYTLLPRSPSSEQRRYHRAVRQIKDELIAQVRPGMRASALYELCTRRMSRCGLDFWMPHVGHGIGIDGGHEFPILEPANTAPLESGMVLCIEPLYTSPEREAYHFEDMIAVEPAGASYLSRVDVEFDSQS